MGRQENMISLDMMYAVQIWESFTASVGIRAIAKDDIEELVRTHIIGARARVHKNNDVDTKQLMDFIQRFRQDCVNAVEPDTPKTLWVPMNCFWDGAKVAERTTDQETQRLVKKFKDACIITKDEKRRPAGRNWGKRRYFFCVNLVKIGLESP